MNKVMAALIGGAVMMIGATGSAEATVFSFTFNAPILHDPDRVVVGQGTIDADDQGSGVFTVTGATGTSDDQGYANTITGGSGTIRAADGGFATDDLFFTTEKGPGFYSFSRNSDGLSYGVMMGEIGSTNATLTLSTAAAAVPEPVTWGMMVIGFAMVGGLMRPRRRGVRVVSA